MDVLVSVIAVITTVAIIAVVVISSPLAPFDLHGLALAAQGARAAQRLDSRGETAAAGENAWAALTAGYPAKAIGVAKSDLEHYADLQATLRPEKSTSGVLSLSFIGSVFYASLISDVDYMPNGLQHSNHLDAGPLLREERTSNVR